MRMPHQTYLSQYGVKSLPFAHLYLRTASEVQPTLVLHTDISSPLFIKFNKIGQNDHTSSHLWLANIDHFVPNSGTWEFQIDLGTGEWLPGAAEKFSTHLHALWIQDGQIFNYQPGPKVSPSRIIKIDSFQGRLKHRALYIYLPRGYKEHKEKSYPVMYMHDGQNAFEKFVEDSYAGSWKADITADKLIALGKMQECIIVGVSNGSQDRMFEYLPPYSSFYPSANKKIETAKLRTLLRVPGRADMTALYYSSDVAPHLNKNYRIKLGREHTATCGSSMGGLFSMYLAWEHSDFAQHHAVLSPSFWVTKTPEGQLEAIRRLQTTPPPDIRLWLDSGTKDNSGKKDGMDYTIIARDALLETGFSIGPNFQYFLDKGAQHNENAWAKRLPRIFQFLFPL